MALTYVKPEKLLLKVHPEFNEAWVQERIKEDASILGLGELDVKDIERRQPKAGRLDLLLHDAELGKRYEVELMLGALDESHIIRTLEYWDIERKRFPQYDHVAVIVAEDITTRYLNVIALFNSTIPIIAIQMNALKHGDQIMLHFTKVLDEVLPGGDDEEESGEVTDRAYWEKKGTKMTVGVVDGCLEVLREIDPTINLKYNKFYIGLTDQSGVNNFVVFRARKKYVGVTAYTSDRQVWVDKLEEAGMTILADTKTDRIRFHVRQDELKQCKQLLKDLFTACYQESKE
jgi:hypothetical protein